jgi:hypothetical protein
MRISPLTRSAAVLLAVSALLLAQEKVDLNVVHKIKTAELAGGGRGGGAG